MRRTGEFESARPKGARARGRRVATSSSPVLPLDASCCSQPVLHDGQTVLPVLPHRVSSTARCSRRRRRGDHDRSIQAAPPPLTAPCSMRWARPASGRPCRAPCPSCASRSGSSRCIASRATPGRSSNRSACRACTAARLDPESRETWVARHVPECAAFVLRRQHDRTKPKCATKCKVPCYHSSSASSPRRAAKCGARRWPVGRDSAGSAAGRSKEERERGKVTGKEVGVVDSLSASGRDAS